MENTKELVSAAGLRGGRRGCPGRTGPEGRRGRAGAAPPSAARSGRAGSGPTARGRQRGGGSAPLPLDWAGPGRAGAALTVRTWGGPDPFVLRSSVASALPGAGSFGAPRRRLGHGAAVSRRSGVPVYFLPS